MDGKHATIRFFFFTALRYLKRVVWLVSLSLSYFRLFVWFVLFILKAMLFPYYVTKLLFPESVTSLVFRMNFINLAVCQFTMFLEFEF